MKKLFLFAAAALVMASCGGKKDQEQTSADNDAAISDVQIADDVQIVDDVRMDEMAVPDEMTEPQEIVAGDVAAPEEKGEIYHLTGGMPGDDKNKMDIKISGNDISGTYEMVNPSYSFTIKKTLRGKIDGNKADIKAYEDNNDLAFAFALDLKYNGNSLTASGKMTMDGKSWDVTYSGSREE